MAREGRERGERLEREGDAAFPEGRGFPDIEMNMDLWMYGYGYVDIRRWK